MSARELGSIIVKRYVESYPSEEVTQSLLDLSQAPQVAEAVDALAGVLLKIINNPDGFVAVHRAIKATQAYAIRDFIDLGDLVNQLLVQLNQVSPAMQEHVIEMLKQGPTFSARSSPPRPTRADGGSLDGVTIYCPTPRSQVSVVYDRLAFAPEYPLGRVHRGLCLSFHSERPLRPPPPLGAGQGSEPLPAAPALLPPSAHVEVWGDSGGHTIWQRERIEDAHRPGPR